MRTIKLMADYQCFPLWEASPGNVGNIDPESLPISQELKSRLYTWALAFDETLNMDYPPDSGFKSAEVEKEFKREGHRIAEQLATELGNEFVVKVHI